MKEGDHLEVCDGRGLIAEAQLKGSSPFQQAFAEAVSQPQQVNYSQQIN